MTTERFQVPLSPAPYSQKGRAAKLVSFTITEDLEMLLQVRVIYVDSEGTPIHQLIDADISLSDSQKLAAKCEFPDRVIQRSTIGAWVNPATGAVVEEGTAGAMKQRDFFQVIPIQTMMALTGTTKTSAFAQMLYTNIAGEMGNIDKRGDL